MFLLSVELLCHEIVSSELSEFGISATYRLTAGRAATKMQNLWMYVSVYCNIMMI